MIPWPTGGVGWSGIDAYDGFYDSVNHRVGFGYDNYPATGLLLINTSDNSIATDIAGADGAAEYSAVDNQVYVADAGKIYVYSATNYDRITTLYTSLYSIEQFRYCSATSEIYGYGRQSYHYGDGIGFYIDPLGHITNSTTEDFTAPSIGNSVVVTIGDTSGMVVGRSAKIDGVDWTITAVDSQTQFEVINLTVSPGTVTAAEKAVTWDGPKLTYLPSVGNVVGLFYSASSERIIFEGTLTTASSVFDPITKTVDCIIPNSQSDDLIYGCEGPDGKLFIPFDTAYYNNGVYVWR